ncbi:MAG TPA: class I SAM-dependent methyltransferase [Hanamia sp.]
MEISESQPWFKDWFNSPYYYQLYFKHDKTEATAFIQNLLKYLDPTQGALMLDIGCGKGRHSVQLASKGFDVTGIDLSERSIGIAKKRENDLLHFYVHDMRLPFFINYFDYAFNFFTSFGYFDTQRENNNAIRTIAQSLKPNGTFVIDYLNVHYAENHLKSQSSIKINDVDYHISRWYDERFFYKKIEVDDKKSGHFLQYHEKVAKFSFGDFIDMLSFQQMQVQEVFGDYTFSNYNVNTSPRMILIARKMVQAAVNKTD